MSAVRKMGKFTNQLWPDWKNTSHRLNYFRRKQMKGIKVYGNSRKKSIFTDFKKLEVAK